MTRAKPNCSDAPGKREVRAAMIAARDALTITVRNQNSAAICDHLLASEYFAAAGHIGIYYAIGNEVDLALFADAARDSGRSIYLPVIDHPAPGHLQFGQWHQNDTLNLNRWGIPEPGQPWVSVEALDLVAVPLVAFDDHGNRIGMGGGYYDRTLGAARLHPVGSYTGTPGSRPESNLPRAVGVAYSFQSVNCLRPDDWDQPLDSVVTEMGWRAATLPTANTTT